MSDINFNEIASKVANERLQPVFTTVASRVDESRINEGVWSVPNTYVKAKKLYDTVAEWTVANDGDHTFTGPLYDLVGNDELFDVLSGLTPQLAALKRKAAKAVISYVRTLLKDYRTDHRQFRDRFEAEAIEILQSLAKLKV
jgi:hypothetical protein